MFNGPLQVRHIRSSRTGSKKGLFTYAGRKNEPEAKFYSGDCAMMTSSSAAYANIKKNAKFKFGVSQLPYYADVKGAPQNTIIGGASLWVMGGKKPIEYKGVAKFFTFLSRPRSRPNGTRRPATCRSPWPPTSSPRSRGSTRRIRAPTSPIEQLIVKTPTKLAGHAPRQLRADPQHHRRGARGGVDAARRRPKQALDEAVERGNEHAVRAVQQGATAGSSRSRAQRRAPARRRRCALAMSDGKARRLPLGWLPYALVAPQLAITLVFFFWPAAQALWQSMLVQDAFGTSTQFVWFDNFRRCSPTPTYLESFRVTAVFSVLVAVLGLSHRAAARGLLADRVVRGADGLQDAADLALRGGAGGRRRCCGCSCSTRRSASSPTRCESIGIDWNHLLNGGQALTLVVIAAVWKQISYNFLFFLAGLQSIPKSLIEAAAIDGAGPVRRFWTIVFPLLSPTTFFLLVVNIVYAFFDTFAHHRRGHRGRPGQATTILVYKVYQDGFKGLDLGGSAAQSVILMAIVIALTVCSSATSSARCSTDMIEHRPVLTFVLPRAADRRRGRASRSRCTSPSSPRRTPPSAGARMCRCRCCPARDLIDNYATVLAHGVDAASSARRSGG